MYKRQASIQPIVCQTTLEAQVRELRLIAEHKPRYNRRSTRPERALWVKLTAEPYPRLSIVREVRDDLASGARYAGPFGSRAAAEAAVAAVHDVLPLRQCTTRLSTKGTGSACVLAEMGRCGAPCEGCLLYTSLAANDLKGREVEHFPPVGGAHPALDEPLTGHLGERDRACDPPNPPVEPRNGISQPHRPGPRLCCQRLCVL